jgi:glycosyltransferase involved in cell wall biosynthesis
MDTTHAPPRTEPDLAHPAAGPAGGDPGWTVARRLATSWEMLTARLREAAEYDSRVAKALTGLAGLAAGGALYLSGFRARGFRTLAKLHRSAYARWSGAAAERLVRSAARAAAAPAGAHPLLAVYRDHVERPRLTPQTAPWAATPALQLRSSVIVVKPARADEKGVLIVNYNYAFPLFAHGFDVTAVARRYHIVLEPSWCGACDLDLLCYARYPFPVFVQAYEPRDAEFLARSGTNLIPIGTSNNWWVDHRLFAPRPDVPKDADVVMVAAWADFKRHHRFFAALARLRRSGARLKAILVGYPGGRSKADVCRQASYYGVADQLEVYENVRPAEVVRHVARAKVNVLWSRKEGWNRALIEAMFAGVPCLLRDGHNYGYRYPYVNPQTGLYATEGDLPAKLLWMVENYRRFAPREWVLEHMSPQHATARVADAVRATAERRGEPWTAGLSVKVNRLNSMGYWDDADAGRFDADYAFLAAAARR